MGSELFITNGCESIPSLATVGEATCWDNQVIAKHDFTGHSGGSSLVLRNLFICTACGNECHTQPQKDESTVQ